MESEKILQTLESIEKRLDDIEIRVRRVEVQGRSCTLCNKQAKDFCRTCNEPMCGWTYCFDSRSKICKNCKVDYRDQCAKQGCKKRRIQPNINLNFSINRRSVPHLFCAEHGCIGRGVNHDFCRNELPEGERSCDECKQAPYEHKETKF